MIDSGKNIIKEIIVASPEEGIILLKSISSSEIENELLLFEYRLNETSRSSSLGLLTYEENQIYKLRLVNGLIEFVDKHEQKIDLNSNKIKAISRKYKRVYPKELKETLSLLLDEIIENVHNYSSIDKAIEKLKYLKAKYPDFEEIIRLERALNIINKISSKRKEDYSAHEYILQENNYNTKELSTEIINRLRHEIKQSIMQKIESERVGYISERERAMLIEASKIELNKLLEKINFFEEEILGRYQHLVMEIEGNLHYIIDRELKTLISEIYLYLSNIKMTIQ